MPGDRRVLLVNSVYHMTNDGAVQVLSGQIAILTGVFTFGPVETGLLGGTALLVNALVQVLTGVMSDRRDPSRFLPIGIAIVGVFSALVAVASSFWELLFFVSLVRVGASFYHPVGMAWIGRAFPPGELDRSLGFQSGFGDAGEVLGTATGAIVGVTWGWQWAFVIWGSANLLAVGAGILLVRGHPAPPLAEAPPTWRDIRRSLWDVKWWLFPLAVGGASYNVIALFGPQLLDKVYGLDPGLAGLSIAVWLAVGTVVALSFGRLSRRFGRFALTVFAYVAVGLASAVAAFFGSAWLVLAALWTLGAGIFLTYPALFAFASEASHRRLQGAAFGMVFFFQLLGGALGTLVAGSLSDAFEADPFLKYAAPFWLSAVVALTTAVYLVLFHRRATDRGADPEASRVGP